MPTPDSSKVVRHLVQQVLRPSSFMDYRLFLASVYSAAKQQLKNYSYQQYSVDLGFSPSNISHQYVAGHRKLTEKAARTIAEVLQLKGDEGVYWTLLVQYCNTASPENRDEIFQGMLKIKTKTLVVDEDRDILQYLAEWYHPVILEMVGLSTFKGDPSWISAQLTPRIRPEQAKGSLELLERLQFIKPDGKGSYIKCQQQVNTGHRVRGIGLNAYHQQMMSRGMESLTNWSGEHRNVSAVTLSLDTVAFEKLRSLVQQFNETAMSIEDQVDEADAIYQLNMQLFPFTLPTKKEGV